MIDRWESLLLEQEYPQDVLSDVACPPEVKALAYRDEEYFLNSDLGKILLSSTDDSSSSSYQQRAKQVVLSKEFPNRSIKAFAIAILNLYLQANYTGPIISCQAICGIISKYNDDGGNNNNNNVKLNVLAKGSGLLLLCVALFSQLTDLDPEDVSSQWWLARALVFLHHASSSSCQDEENIGQQVLSFYNLEPPSLDALSTRLQGLFLAERARAQIMFDEELESTETLQQLAKLDQFEYSLTGARSVRSHHQVKSNPHLIVVATSHSQPPLDNQYYTNDTGLVSLEQCYSHLFESPRYDPGENTQKGEDPNNPSLLAPIDAVVLLLEARRIARSNPFGSPMVKEEINAYLTRVVANDPIPLGPQIYTHAMWEKAQTESHSAKATERGVQLIEKVLGYIDATTNLAGRSQYIHQLIPMARWELTASLADKYMSLGDLEPAGRLFKTELNNPVNAAMCLAATGKKQEAQTQLEQYLSGHQTDARAWSMLGDVTNDSKYWSKAWDLARYPAAKRAWAEKVYKVDHNSEQALQHLRDALSVDGSHFQAWYLYGCIALEMEKFDTGTEAFTRCTQIDDSSYQSWSNLATCLLNQGKPQNAFVALRRAIATSHESPNRWKIWENYGMVAATVGDWGEVVRATKEMIGAKLAAGITTGPVLNYKTIDAIVQQVTKTDYHIERLSHFQKSAIDLICDYLPQVCAGPASAMIYTWSAKVQQWRNHPWIALECYQKAAQLANAQPGIDSSPHVWNQALDATRNLASAYINLGPLPSRFGDTTTVCKNPKPMALQAVNNLLAIGRDKWGESDSYATLISLKQNLSK